MTSNLIDPCEEQLFAGRAIRKEQCSMIFVAFSFYIGLMVAILVLPKLYEHLKN